MTSKLPINLENLRRQRQVEGERIETKAGWNLDANLRTLCAFANDFENLGGGYVVIGQDCDASGMPVFPPVGLEEHQLDKLQQEVLGFCNLIQPTKELDLTEGRSTGISKIIKAMAKNGSPAPEFETDEERSYFLIRLPVHGKAAAWVEDVAGGSGGTTQETTQEKIIALLRTNPTTTRVVLAKSLGLTEDGVKYHLDKLRPAGKISHHGPTKAGHWEITDKS